MGVFWKNAALFHKSCKMAEIPLDIPNGRAYNTLVNSKGAVGHIPTALSLFLRSLAGMPPLKHEIMRTFRTVGSHTTGYWRRNFHEHDP